MPSIQDLYGNADTLKAADLPHGVQVPVIIEGVRAIEFDDGNKLELSFRGKKKVLICNKTNAIRIAAQHGDDYAHWTAKPIYLQRRPDGVPRCVGGLCAGSHHPGQWAGSRPSSRTAASHTTSNTTASNRTKAGRTERTDRC